MRLHLTAAKSLLFLLLFAFMATPVDAASKSSKKKLSEKQMGAYLFTFFNDATHSLFMATSYDGYTFTAVNNGEPIIAGDSIAEQQGIRDPHIYRAPNGSFYMVLTDLHIFGKEKGLRTSQWERPDQYGWGNNRGLVLMKSDDLIHWTHTVVRIDKLFPEKFGDIGCAWAPETIWDPEEGKLMVYFTIREKAGGRTKLYYSYANENFTTLETEPQLLFEYPNDKVQVLDADICPMPDGRYFMSYVAQENPGGVKYMISDKINHFDDYHAEQIDTEPRSCEAPNMWKRIGENKWVLMYDVFSVTPHNFGFVETTDFKTFKPLGRFNEGVMKATNFVSPKHGSVIQITKAEAERLENYWKAQQTKPRTIQSGKKWRDISGNPINAHGGGILNHDDTYYWFGEHKSDNTSSAMVGVMCYSSKDLINWTNRGVALSVTEKAGDDIERGCIMERPKVIYNKLTKKFVMYFHLEMKDKGYSAARYGVAISNKPEGPYEYLYSLRSDAGRYPVEFDKADLAVLDTLNANNFKKWWTPSWLKAVKQGLFIKRDLASGQMSRDMTLYVDDDGKAYHIFASEENLTIHIAELSDDYTAHTGRYTRVAAGGQNEAPAIFKKDGTYWMITSGCTGWAPNEARMFSAPSIWGPWTQHPNPCVGPNAKKTFDGQSTYILEKDGQFIFMGDIWRPQHPSDARYIWLPITFENGKPVVKWRDEWSLSDAPFK